MNTGYLIPLQYGIFHISFLQRQACRHNAEDVVMPSIQLGPLSFTFLFQLLLKQNVQTLLLIRKPLPLN